MCKYTVYKNNMWKRHNGNSRQPPLSYIMNILKNVLLLLLENNIVCIIQIQAVSSKQGIVFIKDLHNWYLIKSIFRITYRTGYDWYNRIGNGIRDPNGTDFVYVFVGETATCVKKSQGVHNKCLKKHNFNFKLWLCALILIQSVQLYVLKMS